MTLQYLTLDFETASQCNLKTAGSDRYAQDLTTEIICLWWRVRGGALTGWHPGEGAPDDLMALAVDPNVTFIAHKADFEKAIWRRILVEQCGWPDVPNNRWHDTMAVCAMKSLPQGLENVSAALRLPVQKDMEGRALTISLSKPVKKKGPMKGYFDRRPETIARVDRYCATDIEGEELLHDRVGWFQPGERKIWLLDQRINERGVRLDMDFVGQAQKIVTDASIPLAKEFSDLTGGLKVTQRDKVLSWLDAEGVALNDMKKETLVELLGSDVDGVEDEEVSDELQTGPDDQRTPLVLPEHVRRALKIRQLIGSASIKKLARMETCVSFDGRARGLLQYHGADTGRWAGRLLQPQNFPRGSLKLGDKAPPPHVVVAAIMTGDWEYVEMVLGTGAVEAVVSSLRHAIIPGIDRALCVGDFSTVEARIVLAMAGQWDKVDLLASGADVYIDMARNIYGRVIDKKKDPEERQTGKNSVLGLGFQMGAPKFQDRYARKHPIEFAERIVAIYRDEWAPEVPKLWYGLERAAVRTVWDKTVNEHAGIEYRLEDGWLTARLPSGRKLYYYNPQPVRKVMPWDHDDVRRAWTYQTMKNGRWSTVDAYGGLLTANAVSATARDLMAAAMFRAEENGLPIVLTVHDEIVSEPSVAKADPIMLRQIMRERPAWAEAMKIPVEADCWSGDRYKK